MAIINNTDDRFLVQIRDQRFHIEVWFYNQTNEEKNPALAIPFFFVEGLSIEETLMTWSTKGHITLSNDFEIFERGSSENQGKPSPFMFRSDARNKIYIKIFPIPNDEGQEFPKDKWEMSYDFIIYDIEDLPTENAGKKLRKFYFWDERYQILLERNIEWSTSKSGGNDESRTMSCSDAIKEIIKTASSNDSNPENENKVLIGFEKKNDNENNTNNQLKSFAYFSEDWDKGSTESKVFYTSPANSNVLQDLGYVFSNMQSENNSSPLFLTLDRYHNDENIKKWSLIPLYSFFESSTKNQIERIVIEDGSSPVVGGQSTDSYIERAPINSDLFQSLITSRITQYKFSPMVGDDEFLFSNSPIYNYSFSNKQFSVYKESNSVEKFLEKLKDNSKGLFGFEKSKQVLLNINPTKQTGLITKNVFISKNFFPKDLSVVRMMKDFLFLNQCLHFTSNGLTLRTPGKVLYVDRDHSFSNDFDDKFLGQWMITNISHNFTKNSYTNNVVANKIDAFSKLFDEKDSTDPKYY